MITSEARVVVIEAPRGYGKTAAAEQLAAAHDGLVVRLRIPPGGADPLTRAVRSGLRRIGSPADFAEPGTGLDHLIAALVAHRGTSLVIVDDVHHLDRIAARELAAAVIDLPAATRLVLCGRDTAEVTAGLSPAVAADRVGPDDLRLDAGQIAARLGLDPTDALVAEVRDATEGWPLVVDLAVERLRRDPTWSATGRAGLRSLFRSLVDDLVSDDERLRRLAHVPLIDDEVMALVLPDHPSIAALPVHRSGPWWVLPDAVRELVEQPAVGSALGADTALAVARHYHRRGETTAALALMSSQPRHELVAFARSLRWDEWADLPFPDVRELVDGLLSTAGEDPDPDTTTIVLDAARSAELTDRVVRARWLGLLETSTAPPHVRHAIAAELARDVLRSGDVARGAKLAHALLADLDDGEGRTRARALVTIGMAEAFACTVDSLAAAARAFDEAAALYRAAGEVQLRAEVLARLGYTALHLSGRVEEAASAMAEALALLPAGDRVRAFWLTNYADVLELLGRSEESDAAVREAREIGRRRGDPTTLGMAAWTASWNAGLRGDAAGLRAALADVERHRGSWLTGGQEAEFLGSSAEMLTLVGDLAGYQQYVARAEEAAIATDYLEVILTPRAYHEAEHGDPAEGLRLLDELERTPGVPPSMAGRRLLMRAVALTRSGDRDAARETWERAVEHVRAIGVPDQLQRHHRRQLARLDSIVATEVDDPARLQVLGGFGLTRRGAECTPQPGHPATLVKLLALRGPSPVESLIDGLWPEVDAATGRSRLRNTLNRLKARSGEIVRRDGEVLRLDDAVTIDLTTFEHATAATLAAEPAERVGLARHALALYTGDLLPADVYEDWAAADRARLQRRFVSLADIVIADCRERREFDEAARLLDLAIEIEPLEDTRVDLLCQILQVRGQAGAARQVARRCLDSFAELGLQPDRDLSAYLS